MLMFFTSLSAQSVCAQVGLRFEAGGGPVFGWVDDSSFGSLKSKKGIASQGMFGIFAEIPVSSSRPFLIETGLGIGGADDAFRYGDVKIDSHSFLRLPVRFDYRLKLSNRTSLTFGLGPYFNWFLDSPKYMGDSHAQVGLTPAVTFRYRKLSLGVSYYNPVIYNGPKDLNKSSLMMTMGLTFNLNKHWKGWKWIGAGAAAAATVATTTALTNPPDSSYDLESRNSDSGQPDNKKSKTTRKNESKYGTADVLSSRTAGNTYGKYVDQILRMKTFGPVDKRQLKQIQKKMKEIREKNNKDSRNFKINKSDLEDWDGIRD